MHKCVKVSFYLIFAIILLTIFTGCVFTMSIMSPIIQFSEYSNCTIIEKFSHSSMFSQINLNKDVCKLNVTNKKYKGKIMFSNNQPYFAGGCPKSWHINTIQKCYCNDLDCFHLTSTIDAVFLFCFCCIILLFVVVGCSCVFCGFIAWLVIKLKDRERGYKKVDKRMLRASKELVNID